MSNHPLRSYRVKAGLSLEELAKSVGVSKASLSRIEKRKQAPSLGLVEKLIGACDGKISASDFLSDPEGTRA